MKALQLNPGFLFRVSKNAATGWVDDNAMRLAASLSYYSVFSIAPLLIIAIGIVGLVFKEEAANGMIAQQLSQLLGPKAAESVQSMVESASKSGAGATLIGFVVLFFGASGVFGELKSALNTVWGVRQKSGLGIMGWLKERLTSFSMVLVIGFLMLVSLTLATVLNGVSGWLERALHLPKFVSTVTGMVLGFGVETLLFATLFRVLPDAKIRWRNVWVGAVFTALLFEIGKMGLAWYLAQQSTTSPFGAAGSLVVLLLWVYYASLILFFGAEFTKVYAGEMGDQIEPNEVAEKIPVAATGASAVTPVVEREPHPLSPSAPVPSSPMRESLAPLLVTPDVESHALREIRLSPALRSAPRSRPGPATPLEQWIEKAHAHPVAEIGAAVGVGLLIGTVSRMMDKKAPALSAHEHFVQGSRKTGVATKSLVLAGASWAAKHLTRRALQHYGEVAKRSGSHVTHALAKRIEKAMN